MKDYSWSRRPLLPRRVVGGLGARLLGRRSATTGLGALRDSHTYRWNLPQHLDSRERDG
jgi:hypothetical protein